MSDCDDLKPTLPSSPLTQSTPPTTPKKRPRSAGDSNRKTDDADIKPSPRKRGRPAGKEPRRGADDPSRKTGSWTKEEVRALWEAVVVIPSTVSWSKVAERVDGRDKLSCSNKWRYDLLPKIQAYIDSLGD